MQSREISFHKTKEIVIPLGICVCVCACLCICVCVCVCECLCVCMWIIVQKVHEMWKENKKSDSVILRFRLFKVLSANLEACEKQPIFVCCISFCSRYLQVLKCPNEH